MFEQQVRIAQALGAAAIASNPLLVRPVPTAEECADRPAEFAGRQGAVRSANVPSMPAAAQNGRTHARSSARI